MIETSVQIGKRSIRFETGAIARQAGGAVVVRDGDTVILVTATADTRPTAADFSPLTVEYRELLASAGRIPGNYFRREGRSTEGETLSSRLVDRSIRPLFPDGFRCETQVIATVLSYDPQSDPEVLSIAGAAGALLVSDIPWEGPVAGVRIGRVDGRWVAFPDSKESERSDLDLVVSAAASGGLVMVEGSARELAEEEIQAALAFAEAALAPTQVALRELAQKAGKPKRPLGIAPPDPALAEEVRHWEERIVEALMATAKAERGARLAAAIEEALRERAAREPEGDPAALEKALQEESHRIARRWILESGRRLDGRGPDDVRPISGVVGWLPRAHGSCLFTRGETQAVVTLTLGAAGDEQEIESLDGVRRDPFLLHYNFPPYSVGEVRALRGPGRREIGHGNLARRALLAVLPSPGEFDFTIRLDSRITESNGSSSMATVCGSTLALMDGGVPIARPVAGVAMGLVAGPEGKNHRVLTDILGDEDHLGDMDFKVAGTARGVTAIQLDNKVGTLPAEILAEGLSKARAARLAVLARMAEILPAVRERTSPHAPQVATAWILPAQIPALIGPGGSTIQGIQRETDTKIDVEQTGRVGVFGTSAGGLSRALARIEEVAGDPEVGKVYKGTVTGVKDFGCFVKIVGGNEGILPSEELAKAGIAELQVGRPVSVKVLGVSERGRIRLAYQA
ncbi:MAG: polyribonucleotide nucleotidyltransferase [Planctomycetes bacterium]|nr:polyribonucleotide nucleotidyltransferase [Planctomycetota bacterium]